GGSPPVARVADWSEQHGWQCRTCQHIFGKHTEGTRHADVDRHQQGKKHRSVAPDRTGFR
ncbi:unnamed protein product, partial [Ectocarpus sp. 12 AP-2014]